MLKWLVAVLATILFVWGLNKVVIALGCEETRTTTCTEEVALGIVGVTLAALSFVYLAWLFSTTQRNM
ncbi:MAG: hypothetical protein ACOCT0_03955 [Halobacteriota archaeon]